jgi:hypothetical protein
VIANTAEAYSCVVVVWHADWMRTRAAAFPRLEETRAQYKAALRLGGALLIGGNARISVAMTARASLAKYAITSYI